MSRSQPLWTMYGALMQRSWSRASAATLLLVILFFVPKLSVAAPIAPGTTQSAAQTANISGLVTTSAGAAVAGADVTITGAAYRLATKTDKTGDFSFTAVPFGVYSISVNSADLGAATRDGLVVKADINVVIQYTREIVKNPKTLAKITVRGSGGNMNVTPASIYSVNPQQYAFQGYTSWTHLLEQIPGVALAGGAVNGGGFARFAGNFAGSPFQLAVLSINGALPYETSTTLDGMPVINYSLNMAGIGAGTDLNNFALNAFDSADVIRGPGANAPSIVDSIGGSLILHAPGFISNDHFDLTLSNDQYGGLNMNSLLQLHVTPKLTTDLGFGAYNSPGPLGTSFYGLTNAFGTAPDSINGRKFWGCGGAYETYGNNNFGTGYNNCYNGNPPAGSPLANICDPSQYQFGCINAGQFGLVICCLKADSSFTKHTYSSAIAYKISPNFTAQVFYAGSTVSDNGGDGYGYATDFAPTGPGYTGALQPGLEILNTATIGGLTTINHQSSYAMEERISALLGRGIMRVAALQDNSYTRFWEGSWSGPPPGQYTLYGSGYWCPDQNCSFFNTESPGQFVVFNGQTATITPQSFTELVQSATDWAHNRDFLASYAYPIGPNTSIGASFVRSYYDKPHEQIASFIAFQNFCPPGQCPPTPSSLNETTREVRVNAESQISEKLDFETSYYWANAIFHRATAQCGVGCEPWYPYHGPRFGLVWRSSPDIAIRAAAGSGFAIPPYNSQPGGDNQVHCNSGVPYCTESINNPTIHPEYSFGEDIGTDLRLRQDLVTSLDFYNTNLWGQFYNLSSFTPPCSTCGGLPLLVTEVDNLTHTRYKGVNLSINYSPPFGFYWNAALGLTRSYIVTLPPDFYNAPGQICDPKNPIFTCQGLYEIPGINFTANGIAGGGAIPYANGNAEIGYRFKSGTSVFAHPTYIGPNNDYYVRAFVEWDAGLSVQPRKEVTVSAILVNVSNIHGVPNNILIPSMGIPTAYGPPIAVYPQTYGPRELLLSTSYHI